MTMRAPGSQKVGGSNPPGSSFLLVDFCVLWLLKSVQEVVILISLLITFRDTKYSKCSVAYLTL